MARKYPVRTYAEFRKILPELPSYFLVSPNIFFCYEWSRLSDTDKMASLFSAMCGYETEASEYVKQGHDRITGAEWQRIREIVFERDGDVCAYCGATKGPFEIDHIHPISRGGGHHLDNLTVACRPCNRRKSNRLDFRPDLNGASE